MKLHKIEINNFHCYQKAEIAFGKETTVLFGKNGSGKTSLIQALANALSVFFSSNTTWGYESLARSVSELGVSNMKVREVWHDNNMKPADHVEIKMTAELYGEQLEDWSFYKTAAEKAKLQNSYYKKAYVKFRELVDHEDKLPVFAYYSDRFPHIDDNLSPTIKEMINNDEDFDRCWGYYHWDYKTSCAIIWQRRFLRVYQDWLTARYELEMQEDQNSNEAKKYKDEIQKHIDELDYIRGFIRRFTDSTIDKLSDTSDTVRITNLEIRGDSEKYIVARFADGSVRRWDELPAGYERIYNLVFDLAYRSFILNGTKSEPVGVVFIDEMDLHLHPSLELDVLLRFKHAFPNVQLIATTHSPLVLSNFEQDDKNIVIKLLYSEGKYQQIRMSNLYGMDYDMTLSAVMETEPRNNYIRFLQEKYKRLISRGKEEKASEILEEICRLMPGTSIDVIKTELNDLA